jgi:hypothetical protein
MTAMSFADSMNSLDAMNDADVTINQIRLPSIKSLAMKVALLFKPSISLRTPEGQYRSQPNIGQHS